MRCIREMRDKIKKSFSSAFLFFIFVFIFILISNNPEGLCDCWVVDSPSCRCFVDGGAWNPFPGQIQVVGISTVGTQESCEIANGGKPFYQMVIGCNSFVQADAISAILSFFPIYERQAWCSETIAYWHREAGIPYAGGYSTWWHSDWSLRSVSQLATWYKVDLRGRWISWKDLSYSDYLPGVTIPVPGAYVATRGFTGQFLTFPVGFTPIWHGFNDSHSQMINEMWVYYDSEGKISRIRVTLLEGNSDNRVRFDRFWDDLISLTPGGPDWVQDDRKIYGFGIDLNSSGQPIYDESRLHHVYEVTFNPVHLVRPLTVIDFDWDTYIAPLVPELNSYARTVESNNGPNITSTSSLVNTEGIPNGINTQWSFPAGLSEDLVIEIDLLDEYPLPVKGAVLNWNAGYLPNNYRIQFADDSSEPPRYEDADIPDTRDFDISNDPNVFISVPATFTSGQAGQKTRYVKLIFPGNTFENDAILEEMRFIYDWDLWKDSNDHPDSKKRTISMSLPAGWSMMSLKVKPDNSSVSSLFSDAEVIYGYEWGNGYVQIKREEGLEAGRGYWVLLKEAKTYIITGEIIEEHNLILQDGWHMIGGCTTEAQALMDDGEIKVIYGYKQGSGYQRVLDTEKLEPGKAYWMLLENISGHARLSVQGRTDCRSCSWVPYVSHHGMSSSTYQDKFDEYVSKGYRLTHVSGYEVSGSARFAAIWEKKTGPSWMAHHDMLSSEYQSKYDEYKDLGYRLIHVSGYTVGGTPNFAAIWEKKSGPLLKARHNMDSSTYQSEFDAYKSQGYRLAHVSGYSDSGSSRFAAIWEKESGPPWTARHDLSSSEYQTEFDDLADLGYKLSHVSGYTVNGTPRFAAIWEKKSGRFAARHGLSSTNYQNEFENYHYQGYRLLKVSGYSQGGKARYAAIWRSLGMKSSDLNFINNTVRPFMEEANVPGLTIAIVKDGRLVFAKGFGYADEGTGEKTSPKHLFRIASISKPITSTAIMKLFEEGKFNSYIDPDPNSDGLDALVFGPSGILAEYSGFGTESYLWEVTVRHLLEHTSGAWGRDFPDPNNYTDPMSYKENLDHHGLITDVLANTENFGGTAGKIWQQAQPGTVYSYSNFGYCILGRVIERITGKPYYEYVKDNILNSCGITDMQIGGSKEDDRVYKEVKYYAGPDNIDPYDTMNIPRMDSHGGWIASAIDLARFIIRVDDLPGKPDILSQTTIQTKMLKAETVGGSYAKGWRIEKVDGSPVVNKWRHSGSLPGSGSRLVRYYNGFSWAIIMNTRVADEYNDDFRNIPYTIIDNVSSWPTYDLF